jgi:nicotinate-nucleotide adenylyltransferase
MLTLATDDELKISVSTLELDHARSRYSFDTLTELMTIYPQDRVFFVMGADSWMDIRTWHRWEEVLLLTDHIVVSRPGYAISFDHVSDAVRERIVDARGEKGPIATRNTPTIYFTDAVHFDISATDIREDIRDDAVLDRTDDVPDVVAKYIEKYELYR